MQRLMAIASLSAGVLLGGASTEAFAKEKFVQRTMGDGQTVDAPRGFVVMCATQPELCVASDSSAGLAPSAEPSDLRKTLRRVNKLVNGRVRQRSDMSVFGRAEYWRRTGLGRQAIGDCEDLAIEKREQLIAAGLPRDMLFFATAWRADLGLHVVLVARTHEGDLVLDSRTPYVQAWTKAPYQWISRQHPDQPARWSVIVDPLDPPRMAARDPAPADIAAAASGALSDAALAIERTVKAARTPTS